MVCPITQGDHNKSSSYSKASSGPRALLLKMAHSFPAKT